MNDLAQIKRATSEIIDEDSIIKAMKEHKENGTAWLVKAGFDPTAPHLHLGHTVLLNKLKTFQDLGANVAFLIGDFTATIGDPSGKSQTRKQLTHEEIMENAKTYEQQVFKILDPKKTNIVFNSSWLKKLGADGLISLSTLFTVSRMLERDDFEKRLLAQTPIAISEFLYPLLQGYDSVALKSTVECGGTDQKFNLLMGRHLQKAHSQKEQAVVMMPILEGLDGVQKMSKSLGNYIGITEPANEIYAKIMSISDELSWRYYELLSSRSIEEIESLKNHVENGKKHPKEAKEDLALEITQRFWDEKKAQEAKTEFNRIHAQKSTPTHMPSVQHKTTISIMQVALDLDFVKGTAEFRRLVSQGAVKLNNEKCHNFDTKLDVGKYILQIGKRKFCEIEVVS